LVSGTRWATVREPARSHCRVFACCSRGLVVPRRQLLSFRVSHRLRPVAPFPRQRFSGIACFVVSFVPAVLIRLTSVTLFSELCLGGCKGGTPPLLAKRGKKMAIPDTPLFVKTQDFILWLIQHTQAGRLVHARRVSALLHLRSEESQNQHRSVRGPSGAPCDCQRHRATV